MSEPVARPTPLGAALAGRLSMLAAALRAGGVRVGLGDLLRAHRALAAVDPASRGDAFYALRSALCSRRADLEVFEAAFAACFGRATESPPDPPLPPALEEAARVALPRMAPPSPSPADDGGGEPLEPEPAAAAASEIELLQHKDFAELTEAERAVARRLIARLAARGPRRLSRRTRPARRRGPHATRRPELRRTVRASLRYGGEPVERRWRTATLRERPLVLVCDVSGSMAPYARMLMQYLHACVAARRRVEAFAFGTRLTRVTRELSTRDPDEALERAAAAAVDWSGGTRIGACLAELNRAHGRRVGRGAVVVLLSDGWERGEPELLAGEMDRLARCAHRVVWLNPLKASPAYEPLTRGMQAALPHVDHFLTGNSVASIAELADLLEGGI